jgi:hypothetical protein
MVKHGYVFPRFFREPPVAILSPVPLPPYTQAKPSLKSGDAKVIAHGSVIPFDDHSAVEISFGVREAVFSLVLEQVVDSENSAPRWEFVPVEGNPQRIRVRMINLLATQIGALPKPWRMWTGPDDSVFLQLRYISLPGFSPLYHYTVYLKPGGATNG